jgi:hypothetical protein
VRFLCSVASGRITQMSPIRVEGRLLATAINPLKPGRVACALGGLLPLPTRSASAQQPDTRPAPTPRVAIRTCKRANYRNGSSAQTELEISRAVHRVVAVRLDLLEAE